MQPAPLPSDEGPLPLPEEQAASAPHPPLKEIFLAWLRIGAFSFGGGAAALFLMRREFVQRRRWNPVFILLAAGIAGVLLHYWEEALNHRDTESTARAEEI